MKNKKESESNWIYNLIIAVALSPLLIIFFGSDRDGRGLSDLIAAPGFMSFFVAILIIFGIIFYQNYTRKRAEKQWRSGVFDSNQNYSDDALMQAYIRLGALMLRQDTQDLKGKLAYLHNYFKKHFENSYTIELSSSLNGAFHNPVELISVTPWLKTHLRSVSQRSHLLYFLAGLSAVDGSINPREKRFLEQVAHQLDVSRKDFESIMAMYSRQEEAFNNQQNRSRTSTQSTSQYKKEKAAKILGISENASTDEIKKAYRSLAKVHHPDKFVGESAAQQKIAEERFIQIQQAYELLLTYNN